MKEHAGASRDAGEQRREQMLRAALDVIVERGYADTRIADVAERTGTSPALVIYYFKTRDQLLTEAIRYSEDTWYAEYLRRMEKIPTAAGQLAELIGMNCLPGTDPEPHSYWLLWLDLWALSPRSAGVAAVREKSDERWRETIRSIVLAGQEAGEFALVDAGRFHDHAVRPARRAGGTDRARRPGGAAAAHVRSCDAVRGRATRV